MSLKLILLVAIAGALGSTLRYLVNLAFLRGGITGLPFATLTVNVLGCFLAGLFLPYLRQNSRNMRFTLRF